MKECERIGELFGEFHDRCLDDGNEKLMRDHFLTCTPCREDFKWYGFTVQALASLEEASPPRDFIAQLNRRLDGAYVTPPSRLSSYLESVRNFFATSPYLPLPVGLATLALVVVVGFAVYDHTGGEYVQPVSVLQAHQETAPGTMTAAADAKVVGSLETSPSQPLYSPPNSSFTSPALSVPRQFASNPKSLTGGIAVGNKRFATVAERIGGDNLTVEATSVDRAIESVKKILLDMRGTVVEEKSPGRVGERVLGVVIPRGAFSNLTTELINHGAVAVGLRPEADLPAPSNSEAGNVMLYIHFVQTQ